MTQPVSAWYVPGATALAMAAVTPQAYGGAADAKIVNDASINSASATLSSASANFVATDVGKTVLLAGAGNAGGTVPLITTILAVLSPTQVTLAATALHTVSGAQLVYGTDNGTAIQKAINAASAMSSALAHGCSVTVVVPAGAYVCGTGISCVTGTRLRGYGATLIGAQPSNAFDATGTLLVGVGTFGAAIPLAANVSRGAKTVTINGTVSIGQTIILYDNQLGGRYQVTNVSGASPQTVTLDRALSYSFQSATTNVYVMQTLVDDVMIEGFTIGGWCGARYFEFTPARNIELKDVTFVGTWGTTIDRVGGFDSFSYDVRMNHVRVIGQTNGIAYENCEWPAVIGYEFDALGVAQQSQAYGLEMTNCANGMLSSFSIHGAYNGIAIVAQQPPSYTPGSLGCTVRDGQITECSNYGALLDNDESVTIDSVRVYGCASVGVAVGPGANALKIVRCTVQANAGGGIQQSVQTSAAIKPLVIRDTDVSFNTGFGIQCFGSAFLSGITSQGATGATTSEIIISDGQGGTPEVILDGFDITANNNAIEVVGTSPHARIRNGRAQAGTGWYGVLFQPSTSGRLSIDHTTVTQAGAGSTGIYTQAGTSLRLGPNNDFGGCTTPTNINGATSKGTVIANGTTGVSIAFPDAKATDRLVFALHTIGGTVGHPKYTTTPGTGFTFTSDASDTSTWEYTVQ